MKSILYVGATLMIGASIYGFVDYNKTSRNREFRDMYEPGNPVIAKETAVSENQAQTKMDLPKTAAISTEAVKEIKTPAVKTKKAVVKAESVEPTEQAMKSNISIEAAEKISASPAPEASLKEILSAKKYKTEKKKKWNYKSFGRARIREYEEEVILPKPRKASKIKE
jgi:hypothetical protein